ncbi:MAG: hypothetical protein KAT48_12485, partial [Bacteroidales bacterium]|nr:hypothetical protein [Bacteroidales bacterium]
ITRKLGLDHIDKRMESKIYKRDMAYNNWILALTYRLKDSKQFESRLSSAENDFKQMIKTETEKESKRLIEILGFFSAIVAFILASVAISNPFSFEDALMFNISLGIILLIFVLVISLLFSQKDTWKKLIIAICLILLLMLIVYQFAWS